MNKSNVVAANVIGHTLAAALTPFFNGRTKQQFCFEGRQKISDVFTDEIVAAEIAQQLHKQMHAEILCEELLQIKRLILINKTDRVIALNLTGIEHLANLKVLIVHHYNLTFSDKMQHLSMLKEIDVKDNTLMVIPDDIFKLPNLRKLKIRYSKIQTLPSTICFAKKLVSLDVSHNQLTILPAEIGMLHKLKVLNCAVNPLEQLPVEISYLQQLTSLSVRKTKLTELPSTINMLAHLQYLNINQTDIKFVSNQIYSQSFRTLKLVGAQLDTTMNQYLPEPHKAKMNPKILYAMVGSVSTLTCMWAIYMLQHNKGGKKK